MRTITALFLALALLAAPGHAQAQQTLFVVGNGGKIQTFVIALTDPARIAEARDIISGKEKLRVHVSGRIVKEPAPYNRPWRFHLEPDSIRFFESSIEVCDASTTYVEAHLAEVGGAFLPGSWWCPWSSRVVHEVK